MFHRFLFLFVIFTSFFAPCITSSDVQAEQKTPIISSRHKFQPSQGAALAEEEVERPVRVNLVGTGGGKRRPVQQAAIAALPPSALQELLSSKSAIVLDAQNGTTLYAHNPDMPGQPASTIKVLTGLIALQSLNDNDKVRVSRYAANMPRSKVYLRQGRSYCADDLINAVLLASANDASVALAEKLAGSEKAFAKLMTEKARALGATNTLCKSASGLTRREQYSTARDLAKIFIAAMEDQEFVERIAMKKTKMRDGKTLRTHNKALWNVDGAVGGKTGYTRAARQTYVGKFKRGEDELIVAIMGSETMWDDISRLVEFGFIQKQQGIGLPQTAQVQDSTVQMPPAVIRIIPDRELAAIQILSDSKKESKL